MGAMKTGIDAVERHMESGAASVLNRGTQMLE
jgi:hypothetical protein